MKNLKNTNKNNVQGFLTSDYSYENSDERSKRIMKKNLFNFNSSAFSSGHSRFEIGRVVLLLAVLSTVLLSFTFSGCAKSPPNLPAGSTTTSSTAEHTHGETEEENVPTDLTTTTMEVIYASYPAGYSNDSSVETNQTATEDTGSATSETKDPLLTETFTYITGFPHVITHAEESKTTNADMTPSTTASCNHKYVGNITKEATCEKDGVKTFTCRVCGDSYTEVIKALGHKYTSKIAKEATCSAEGEKIFTCSVCGHSYSEKIPQLEHKWGKETVGREATCEAEGYKVKTCSLCGVDSYTTIPKKEHSFGKETVGREATCSSEGYKVKTCTVCGTDSYTTIPKLSHKWEEKITTPATCTTDGIKTITCKLCGDVKTEIIKKLGHDYKKTVTAPTCSEKGFTTYTCSRCGDSYKADYVNATGIHTKGESLGGGKYKCSVCGKTFSDPDYDGHVWTVSLDPKDLLVEVKNPYPKNSTIGGLKMYSSKSVGSAKNKTFTYHCDDCGEDKAVEKCTADHDYQNVGYVYAICGKRINLIVQCKTCGLIQEYTVSTLGSIKNPYTSCSYTAWKTVVNNSAKTNKVEERHCEHCGKVEYRVYDGNGKEMKVSDTGQFGSTDNEFHASIETGLPGTTFGSIVLIDKRVGVATNKLPFIKQSSQTTGTIYWIDNKGTQRQVSYDLESAAKNAYDTNAKWKARVDAGSNVYAAFIIEIYEDGTCGSRWIANI